MVCKECQECIDFMGTSVYPYHGLAPHESFRLEGKSVIMGTFYHSKEKHQANFVPDDPEDEHSMGEYFCPNEGCENHAPL